MNEEQKKHKHDEQELVSRREYLISLKKWSKIAIGAAVLGASVLGTSKDTKAAAWANRRGGGGAAWGNGGGGAWRNGGGGAWGNGGGWRNGGGGGTAWVNNRGGWRNGSSGWRNGSGGWVNRRY